MTILYILDVDDFRPLAQVAAKNPDVTVLKLGPYYQVHTGSPLEIDRDATGCRNAVWFSTIAAIADGAVTRWDRTVMCIDPVDATTGLQHPQVSGASGVA